MLKKWRACCCVSSRMAPCDSIFEAKDCDGRRSFRGTPRRRKRSDCSRTSSMVPARPLKFCMVTTFYPPYHFGGDAIGVQRLARGLVRRGHEVTVIHDVDAYNLLHQGSEP